MPTASYLIADMQAKLGDSLGNVFTSANFLNWLNEAQKEFCTEVMPLRIIDATVIGTGFQRFPIPSNKIMMDGVFSRNSIGLKMKAMSFDEWNTQNAACPGARGKDSDCWTEVDQNLYVFPSYGTAGKTTFLPLGATSTATTLQVNSTAGFKAWGRLLTNGEEIEYSSIDATNFYGCTRGLGNTNPTSLLKGSLVTQCDLWMIYRRTATTLATVTDTPEIKACWHEHLQTYAMYLAYSQVGEMEKAKAMHDAWKDAIAGARYSAMREFLGTMHVHDTETEGGTR